MRRVNAIFQKDVKDASRNSAVSVTVLMPLLMAFIMGKMYREISIDAHYMIINFTMVIVGAFVQCSLIAEEKEKNTLRGLMLSPSSTMEILGGKSLLSFVSTMIVILISVYLTGYQPENIFVVTLAIILTSFFSIGLGTLLGLFAKSVMEASVIAIPFMLIFGLGTVFSVFAEKYPILKIMDYTPSAQLVEVAMADAAGSGFGDVLGNLGIITAWIVVIFGLAVFVFKKRKMD